MERHFCGNHIKVLVAYDNFSSGCRVMALLKRLGGGAATLDDLTHVMVRFDLLADAAFFELAVGEARAADLIVIATCEGRELPREVRDWLGQWLLRRDDVPQALVGTFDYGRTKVCGPGCVSAYLEKLAGYGNIPFFTSGGDQAPAVDFGRVAGDDWAVDSALVRQQTAGPN